jgi:hypothetical protein
MLKVRNIHLTWASRSRHATSSTRSARKDCTDLRLEPLSFAELLRNHRKASLCLSIVSRFFLHLHVLLPINGVFCKFQAEIVHLTMAGFWASKSWSPPRRHRIPACLSEERSNTSRCCCRLNVLWMAIPKVLAGWESSGISQLLTCKPWEVWIKLCSSAVLSLQHLASSALCFANQVFEHVCCTCLYCSNCSSVLLFFSPLFFWVWFLFVAVCQFVVRYEICITFL